MKTYKKGEIIFKQGDAAQSMFIVDFGSVGIYLDYGTNKEKKLAELYDEDSFGEMGMIDCEARSATAVALENGTVLSEVTQEKLGELFRKTPARVLMIMQQLSKRLRRLTIEYMNVCQTAAELTGKAGNKSEQELIEKTGRIMERRQSVIASES